MTITAYTLLVIYAPAALFVIILCALLGFLSLLDDMDDDRHD